jgi:NHLM bacteriocin system ABC transporter peptidase/ATP-binding protein
MEATECGAAALAIILGFYGRHISLAEVRAECGVSRDGSRALNILKAARTYGMKADAAMVEELESLSEVTLPCIMYWQFNHFIVLEGIDKENVYINDPQIGPRVISLSELNEGFTGVVLMFEPTPDFQRGGRPFSVLDVIRKRLKSSKNALIYIFIVSFISVIPGILIAGFSKIFIDNILIKKTPHWLALLLIGIALTALLRGLCTWLQQIHVLRLQIKLLFHSSIQFLSHVLHLPVTFFHQRYAGDIEERISANSRIAETLSVNVSSSVISLMMVIFYFFVMLLISWPLALIGIIAALSNGFLLYKLYHHIANMSFRFLQEQGKLAGIEMNGLQIIETIKTSGLDEFFFERWAGLHARTINSQQKIAFYTTLLQCIPSLLTALSEVIFLGLGSYIIIRGDLTLGGLVAMQSLFSSFMEPLNTLIEVAGELPKIRGDLHRIDDVLEHKAHFRFEQQIEGEVKKLSGALHMKDITFGYSQLDKPLLTNFSLDVKPNQAIAIVGQSGSGKSTIAKLIAGLYQPWSGTIELDGILLEHINAKQLANTLALIDQDIFLFTGSLRDNLTLWNKEIPDALIEKALHDACIYDELSERGGISAEIMERGYNFSGGQRQRLEIARALTTEPSLLILDEATSALDPIVEAQILKNLRQRGYTMIIVTHRLNVVQDCDHIIVMEQGNIAASGTHNALMATDGLYRKMYDAALHAD